MGDWELFKENLQEDIFLRSSVPIYVRSAMGEKEEYAFQIFAGDELQLVLDPPTYIKWRTKIIDKDRKISEGITVISQKIENLERLLKDIEHQLDKEPSETILVKLNENEGELEKLKLENIKLEETIANLEEKLSKHIHKLDTLKKQNHDTNQNINILAQFVEQLQQLKSREVEILEARENLKAIKLRKGHIEENIYHCRN